MVHKFDDCGFSQPIRATAACRRRRGGFSRRLALARTLDEMIKLSSAPLIGEGWARRCFVHPEDPGRCVKIAKPGKDGAHRRAKRGWFGRFRTAASYDETLCEMAEMNLLWRIGGKEVPKHLPRHFGLVKTDLGTGAVVERLRDFDGGQPPTLRDAILRGGICAELKIALDEFRAFLRLNHLTRWDAYPANILCVRIAPGRIRLFVADGLGRHLTLAARMFAFERKRRAKKRATLFEARVAAHLREYQGAAKRRIFICVPTFRRPDFLDRCLDSIAALQAPPDCEVSVLICDNDAAGSARAAVMSRLGDFPFALRYEVEARRGRSFARNRCLDAAALDGAAFVLFIDDDMTVTPDYLRALTDEAKALRADAVVGRIDYLGHPPRDRKFRRQTAKANWLGTGGAMIGAKIFRDWNLRFDPRFARGEDLDYFYRAGLRGARLFQTSNAAAFEMPRSGPASRPFRRWFETAQNRMFIIRLRGGVFRALAYFAPRAIGRICGALAQSFRAVFGGGRKRAIRAGGDLVFLAGLVSGLFVNNSIISRRTEDAPRVLADFRQAEVAARRREIKKARR